MATAYATSATPNSDQPRIIRAKDWCLRPVSDMGDVMAGKALAVDAPGDLRPYLRTKNVFDGRIDIDDVLSMPMTDKQFSQFMLQDGDVLLTRPIRGLPRT